MTSNRLYDAHGSPFFHPVVFARPGIDRLFRRETGPGRDRRCRVGRQHRKRIISPIQRIGTNRASVLDVIVHGRGPIFPSHNEEFH